MLVSVQNQNCPRLFVNFTQQYGDSCSKNKNQYEKQHQKIQQREKYYFFGHEILQ